MEKLVFADNYKSEKAYPFPDEEKLSQSQRNSPEYYISCCNAMVSTYCNNAGAIPYDSVLQGRRSFQELRAYRKGLNSPNKYKPYFIGLQKEVGKALNLEEAKGKGKTTINISWDTIPYLPKKIGDALGYMQKINYDVQTSAIDYEALVNKKTMVAMAKIHADHRMQYMEQQVNQAAGMKVLSEQDPSQLPGGTKFNSPKEVDIAAAVGVFYLEQEAAIQTLLTKSSEESVSDVLNDQVKDDILTIGISGKRVTTNPNTHIVTEDWVDMDRVGMPWSQYLDYRDITWAFEFRRVTIAQLRKECKIEEEELIKIARSYSTNANTATTWSRNFYMNIQNQRQKLDFGMNMMDQILVDVADCRWIGVKGYDYTSVRNKNTDTIINMPVRNDYKLSPKDERDGKELYNYQNQTVYKAKLVLGSALVFDYGEDNDIAFEKTNTGKMIPVFPYKFCRIPGMSLVERTLSFMDDANLANYKLRIARQKMPAPPNLFIDKSALEGGVMIDGVNYKPHQLMRLLQDEGFLVGDSKNAWGQNNQSGRAVIPIGTDMIQIIAAWVNDRDQSLAMIDKLTGINDMFSAQTPQRTTAVGTGQQLIAGTQNALTPEVKTYAYLFEQTERVKVKKWQIVASNMSEEERKKLSINRALKTVKIGSDLQDYDFDIQIHAAISDQEKAELLQDIKDMRNLRRQVGSGGINESDYMLLYNMVKSGKFVQAQLSLAAIIDSREKADQAKQQQMVEANSQAQQQSNQQAAQNDAQNNKQDKDLELRNKNAELLQKYKLESLLQAQKGRDERHALALQNIWGSHHKQAS